MTQYQQRVLVLTPPTAAAAVQYQDWSPQWSDIRRRGTVAALLQADAPPLTPAIVFALPLAVFPDDLQGRLGLDRSYHDDGAGRAAVSYLVQPDAPILPRRRPVQPGGDIWPFQGSIFSITPQGYWAVYPDLFKGPKPLTAMELPAQQVPSPTTPQGWPAEFPVRFKGPRPFPREELPPLPPAPVFLPWDTFPARSIPAKPLNFVDLPPEQVPTQFIASGWQVFWDGPPRKPYPVKLQRDNDPVLGAYSSVVVTYPEGWRVDPAPVTLLRGRRDAAADLPISARATYLAWVVEPPARRSARSSIPVPEVIVPAPATNLAWHVSPDVRGARRPLPGGDIWPFDGTIVSVTPQGWPSEVPVLFKAPRALPHFDLPYQQVPTVFVGNAWNVDGIPLVNRRAKRPDWADLSIPAAATPFGWANIYPDRLARPSPRVEFLQPPFVVQVLVFQGWGVEFLQPVNRRRRDLTQALLPAQTVTTPSGFSVSAPEPIRARIRQPGWIDAPLPARAGAVGAFVDFPVPLPIRRRPAAGEAPIGYRVIIATPGNSDLWSFYSYQLPKFRGIPEWGFAAMPRLGIRIVSQPTLLAQDSQPTMDAADAPPTLVGQKSQAALYAEDAQPTLLGEKSEPDLEGEV